MVEFTAQRLRARGIVPAAILAKSLREYIYEVLSNI
jgi:hypothetical protein